jgi:phospholipid transport system substrate-binding protein
MIRFESRRLFLGRILGVAALPAFAAMASGPARAQEAAKEVPPGDDANPAKAVEAYYAALLDVMKRAKDLGIKGRYAQLEPAIAKTFDLPAMTRISIGPAWTSLAPDQQQKLVDAFARMTVATYANRFDGYGGEKFEVDAKVETRGNDRVVKTKLVQTADEPVTLNYLMRKSGEAWKVVDVYLSGTISELATRRSEFTALLRSGGADALLANLKQRTDDLMAPTG